MNELILLQREDLRDFLREVIIDSFSNIEVDTHTVSQILKISKSTVNRYVENNLLKVVNKGEGDRRFLLSEILYINRQEIKKENRIINKTQVKPKKIRK